MIALVLGGGPDAEREVSLASSSAVAQAIAEHGEYEVRYELIDAPDSIAGLAGDVVVPVLHGSWGEGGRLQDILERDGRPYIGSGPRAARLCMDKLATKLIGASEGLRTPEAALINPGDPVSPVEAPAVVKPVHEGSSVGLHICHDRASLDAAITSIDRASPAMMIERLVVGRELTCGLIDRGHGLEALPLVEIAPAEGVYDYAAKYDRDDTRYFVGDRITPGVDVEGVQRDSVRVATALGARHLARVDFMLDDRGRHWLLEVNTMPGFTGHSLLPKAAASVGIGMGELCSGLCGLAIAGHSSRRTDSAEG